MKLTKVVTGVLLATGAIGVQAGEFKTAQVPSNAIKGQYIVVLKDNAVAENEGLFASQANLKAVQMVNDQLSNKYQARVTRTYKTVLKGGVYKMSADQAQKLAQDPSVELVEEDQMMSINATQNNATWGLDRTDQRNLPLSGTYTYNTTASNVNAYIIDTGILNSHSDFGGRSFSGIDTVDNDGDATDCNGHGTHVAGTVGGSTWGIAKNVTLYGVRVLGCNGSGSNSGVIAGMDWVADNHVKPAVANMSLGGGSSSTTERNAMQSFTDAGMLLVAAAGNDGNSAKSYPASYDAVMSVAAVDSSENRASYSQYNDQVEIAAPGSAVQSTYPTNTYASLSGTSMATPHVAGGAALVWSYFPQCSNNQIRSALNATAKDKGSAGRDNFYGYGLMQLADAYNYLNTNGCAGGGTGGGGGGGSEPGVEPVSGQLTGLSGSRGNWDRYTWTIPEGVTQMTISTAGGSGDADLYVKFGSQPETNSYDCRPYQNGNSEVCTFDAPASGTWHIGIRAYSSYSGVTLSYSYE